MTRCETTLELALALEVSRRRVWFNAAGGVAQRLVPPAGFDLRIVVAGGAVVGAVMRQAAPGEWRTNVALGGRRIPVAPPVEACELALAAAEAVGGDLVGVDLLPAAGDAWLVLEVNGAVDFNGCYSLDAEIFSAVRTALLAGVGFETDAQISGGALGDGLPDGLDRLRRSGALGPVAAG